MKNKKKTIIILITLIIIITFFSIVFIKNKKDNNINNMIEDQNIDTNINIYENNEVQKIDKYKDENPVPIGIYITKGNKKVLIKDTYYCNWQSEEVMGLFFAIPTNDDEIYSNSFNEIWNKYISDYPNKEKYRIGYNLKYTLNTGETIDSVILSHEDAFYMFPKVMCFLYDDVNFVTGQKYYHITSMNDYTICSSIKLVGDVETKNIISPIELTAFCFDSEDDFDENTHKYRGNSSYTINIMKN